MARRRKPVRALSQAHSRIEHAIHQYTDAFERGLHWNVTFTVDTTAVWIGNNTYTYVQVHGE